MTKGNIYKEVRLGGRGGEGRGDNLSIYLTTTNFQSQQSFALLSPD